MAQPNLGTQLSVTFVLGIVRDGESHYLLDTERSLGLLPTSGTAPIGGKPEFFAMWFINSMGHHNIGIFRAMETYVETPRLHNISNPNQGVQCSLI